VLADFERDSARVHEAASTRMRADLEASSEKVKADLSAQLQQEKEAHEESKRQWKVPSSSLFIN
jgi:hypothetical protein